MSNDEQHFTVRLSSNCLVITLQGSLSIQHIDVVRQATLDKLHHGSVKAVIIDLAGVPIIDGVEFNALCKILTMGSLMGAEQMMVGIHAGIASALVEMDLDFSQVTHAHTVDDALAMIN